jgi:hypothetical protein
MDDLTAPNESDAIHDSGIGDLSLTDDELALKRAILSKFSSQAARSKNELDELLEELVRLNIR